MFHPSRFPRLYAAASLKHADHVQGRDDPPGLSAALCRGLIEASSQTFSLTGRWARLSAALCRGLIEAPTSCA